MLLSFKKLCEMTDDNQDRDNITSAPLAGALHLLGLGDVSSLKVVYKLTHEKLFGICVRICRDKETAEDVLQEAYIKIARVAKGYEPAKSSPMPWLGTIVRNLAIDRLRMDGRKRHIAADLLPEIMDTQPLADESLLHRERSEAVLLCIERLNDQEGVAIRSAFFGGFSYPELSELIETPLGTIKSRIRRALLKLRDCLESL